MTRVLFIGHYKDSTGHAQAAIDWILSLDTVSVDVVPRPVKLNSNIPDLPLRIQQLEQKSSKDCNICVQNVLPHLMDYNGNFDKNIGMFFADTNSIKYSSWPERLNLMDEIWVPNTDMIQTCVSSGVTVPIHVVPCATDIKKFEQKYKILDIPELTDNFVFYTIGDSVRRKNLSALLRAFHLEFSINESVSLLIKTTKYGMHPDETFKNVKAMCDIVKRELKIYPRIEDYMHEIIITEHMKEYTLMRLHNTCDCFVLPSFGEAYSLPNFDAMGFGKTPICAEVGGPKDYLKGSQNFVKGNWEPVFGMTETFPDINTGRENWFNISIRDLQKQMRKAYSRRDDVRKSIQSYDKKRLVDYSYETIGSKMKELL